MEECIADSLFRSSGKIELVKTFDFVMPNKFDLAGEIAAMRRESSGIYMGEIKDDSTITESRNRLVPGKRYGLSIYSAISVTALACYCRLREDGSLFLGGQAAVVMWALLKDVLFEAVGPQKDCMAVTSVLSFPGADSPIELRRYNLGKDSFWEMNLGPFDDNGFYLDAYLLSFKRT